MGRLLSGLVVAVAGCGLYAGGTGGTPPITDAASDRPAPPACAPDGACLGALPAGWSVVALEGSPAQACPAGFASLDLVSQPTAQADACTCTCTIQQAPSCATGMVSVYHNGNCVSVYGMYAVSDGKCVAYSTLALGSPHAVTQLPLTPGSCTGGVSGDDSKVTTTAVRRCAPSAECREDACRGNLPTGLRACIAHDGDVACPPGPFADKTVAGTGVTVGCNDCTSCTASATCPVGTLGFFSDASCTASVASIAADGQCHTNQTTGGGNLYIRYDAPAQGVACQPGTSTPKDATLASPITFCCR